MADQEDDRASRPDEENLEWTERNFRNARPALELIAETSGPSTADALRRRLGRPVGEGCGSTVMCWKPIGAKEEAGKPA